jgi:hypothetical protein
VPVRKAISSLTMDSSVPNRHGALSTVVELIEQSRAVFWTQLARFCTLLDHPSAVVVDTGAAVQVAEWYTFDQSKASLLSM